MKNIIIAILATSYATSAVSTAAETGCRTSPMELDMCLSSKLDKMSSKLDQTLKTTFAYVHTIATEAPEAKIDEKSVISVLNEAQQQWLKYAETECLAAREFVGDGTSRNSTEMLCLIKLYDQRIKELETWR